MSYIRISEFEKRRIRAKRKKWLKRRAGELLVVLAVFALAAVSIGIGVLLKTLF